MAHISIPSTSANITGDINNSTGVNPALERRCDDPDCHVNAMVSKVPKCSTPQFVTEPSVMEKPLLINGFTTIFQVEGHSAKLADIKNPTGQKPLYRIVPNTHAHIINYVVVDSDTESLRKINEQDPAIMRKLLDSQKESADQMLKKLIAGHGAPISHFNANDPSTAIPTSTMSTSTSASVGSATATPVSITKLPPNYIRATATSTPLTSQQQQTMQLPPSIHPNLKITAVASAEDTMLAGKSVASLLSQAQQQQKTPLITPVPLANLQRASISSTSASSMNILPTAPIQQANISGIGNNSMSTLSTTAVIQPVQNSSVASGIGDLVEKPVFDKMQKELEELRRTVERLAKAQANQNQN